MNRRSTSNLRPNQLTNSASRFIKLNQMDSNKSIHNSLTRLIKSPQSNSKDNINNSESKKILKENLMQSKLAYEWKNIYRNLLQHNKDPEKTDNQLIDLKSFDLICQKFKVNLTKDELRKIA